MPVLKRPQVKNTWKQICDEVQSFSIPIAKDRENDIVEFDASKHSLVFYGQAYKFSKIDDDRLLQFDSSMSHPACFGYTIEKFEEKVEDSVKPTFSLNRRTCTEREFLERLVFPTLLPALEKMLAEAQRNKCCERKRTAFNGCDFLTDYLYKNNPMRSKSDLEERNKLTFWNIPFIEEWNRIHPRPPLPKSLIWTEEEAGLRIQAFYRGYLVRRDPEVQELRKWQRELREENQNITERVEKFWNEQTALSVNKLSKPENKNLRDSITIKSSGFK